MNAYTPFPATRTHNGVSLPRLPWDVDAPEPQAERKVTVMPATIRKVIQPKDAPEPIQKPHKYYTDKRIGETDEEWVARDWALRIRNEPQVAFTNAYARDGRLSQISGKLAAHQRRQQDSYKAKRQAIIDTLRETPATCQEIMERVGIISKGGMNEVLRGMLENGQIKREKVKLGPRKKLFVYTVAADAVNILATIKEASE